MKTAKTATCLKCHRIFTPTSNSAGTFCSQKCYMDSPRPLRKPLIDRFWEKVNKTSSCWLWTGSKVKGKWGGYGAIRLEHRGKNMKAHRVSWQIHFGEIPKGLLVLHKCDNPPCVRPDHLFIGTNSDNMRDCDKKGRRIYADARGENNNLSKLKVQEVLEIRAKRLEGADFVDLGKRFGVSVATIRDIIARKRWKHI